MLIGVSGQPGAFSEPVVRAMAREQPPAGHLPAVEPDLARRGDARGHRALERGPRGHRHRQPVPAAGARRRASSRSTRPTTPTSSRASGSARSRCKARRVTDAMFMAAAKALAAAVAGAQRHRQQSAAAGDGVARGLDRGGAGDGVAGAQGRADQEFDDGRDRGGDPRQDVDAALPAIPPRRRPPTGVRSIASAVRRAGVGALTRRGTDYVDRLCPAGRKRQRQAADDNHPCNYSPHRRSVSLTTISGGTSRRQAGLSVVTTSTTAGLPPQNGRGPQNRQSRRRIGGPVSGLLGSGPSSLLPVLMLSARFSTRLQSAATRIISAHRGERIPDLALYAKLW